MRECIHSANGTFLRRRLWSTMEWCPGLLGQGGMHPGEGFLVLVIVPGAFPHQPVLGCEDSYGFCDCFLSPEVADLVFVLISLNRFSRAIKAGGNILHPRTATLQIANYLFLILNTCTGDAWNRFFIISVVLK